MTDKKISRRGFIKGLAACSVAIPLAPLLIKEEPKVVDVVGMVDKPLDVGRRTIRKGLPDVAWRKINESRELIKTDKVMNDLPWKELR